MKTIISDIPDYETFYRGEQTVEIGYPWLTFGAIMMLEKILGDSRGTFNILEMGAGGSTIFFEKRCRRLLSLEDDRAWVKKLRRRVRSDHVQIRYKRCHQFVRIIQAEPNRSFDIILADFGSGGAAYVKRQMLLDVSIPKLKIGGWLILDNYQHLSFDYTTGWDVYTFDMLRYSGRGTRFCKKL